jgi:ATP-dependent protease ClpP protease subunit
VECTGQSYEDVVADCDRDNYISAADAAKYGKYGLVDKVVKKR